jgi:hypothetical protein
VVSQGVVEAFDRDIHTLNSEEALSVIVVGVLEGYIEADTFWTELNVKDTRVLEWHETGLLGHPEGNVGSGEVETLDSES